MRKKIFLLVSFFYFLLSWAEAEEVISWQECIMQAKNNHPDLISAQENIKQQIANKSIVSSELFPQLEANLGVLSSTTKNKDSGNTTKTTTDSYNYGLSASQLFFDGFKTSYKIKSALENIKSAQENYRFVSAQVRFNLRVAFIDLLKAQELIKVAEEIVKIRRENLELVTLRYESGLEHRGALLTAEANLLSANFELNQAKRNLEVAQNRLCKEMGLKEFKPILVKGDFQIEEDTQQEPDFIRLVQDNPSLRQILAKKNAANFDIKSAYSDFYPTISGSSSIFKKDNHWLPENENWNVGITVSIPIFEGGLRQAQVSKAKALYSQLEADERSIRDSLTVTLKQYWADLQDALEMVEVQRKTLEAAEERSRIAEAQYSTGFITFDNWIIIENDLVKAKKAYLDALANALLAEANWIYAKGGTLEYAQK